VFHRPEPAYLKITTDSACPVRIGSPIFPDIEKEEAAQRQKWQSVRPSAATSLVAMRRFRSVTDWRAQRREAVQTPEEDPAEASMPLYYFHPTTGEVVMPYELPPDVREELKAEAVAAAGV
jgi:hypothetical protein